MERILIVVDMQNDFVTGALGTKEAEEIVEAVRHKAETFDGQIVMTLDTHDAAYLNTQEGKLLPVPHCVKGTEGWQLVPALEEVRKKRGAQVFEKPTFGSLALAQFLAERHQREGIAQIELVGVCTDICVVSNALLLKAFLPEVHLQVDASCCAGVTPEKHRAALETLRSCQIQVMEEGEA